MANIFILILYIYSVSVLGKEFQTNNLNQEIKQFNFKIFDGEKCNVLKSVKRTGNSMTFYNIIAEKEKTRIELEITLPVNQNEIQTIITTQIGLVKKLYGPQYTPYQGAVTNITSCTGDYLPKEQNIKVLGEETHILIANANNRYVLGVCDKNETKIKVVLAYIYLKTTSALIYFKIFSPKENFSENSIVNILKKIKPVNL
jgi:hypothetical protein